MDTTIEAPPSAASPISSLPRAGAAFVALLGALTMLPPLSIDVCLPGLPAMALSLHASAGAMQWTLSAFVLAFGGGQLVLGPLSDRYGRKPVLFLGIGAFTASAIACALVTNVDALIALRFVQGFAACAGTVCARAIVTDIARNREHATSLQAYVSATNALAPLVAPLLGAAILSIVDWRFLYAVLALAGIGLIGAIVKGLPETSLLAARSAIAGYRRMLAFPRTAALLLLVFCAFGSYFAFISASSLVLETQMHVSNFVFVAAFAVNAGAAMAGSFVAGRFAAKIGPDRLMRLGAWSMLASAGSALVASVCIPSPLAFTVTMAALAFSYSLVVPGAYAAVLMRAGPDAGSGAALLGSAQMIGGSLGSASVGALHVAPAIAVGIVALIGAAGVVASR